MTSITKQHIGKYTYLYESTSYRDKQGRPRNKKNKNRNNKPKHQRNNLHTTIHKNPPPNTNNNNHHKQHKKNHRQNQNLRHTILPNPTRPKNKPNTNPKNNIPHKLERHLHPSQLPNNPKQPSHVLPRMANRKPLAKRNRKTHQPKNKPTINRHNRRPKKPILQTMAQPHKRTRTHSPRHNQHLLLLHKTK